MIRIPALVEPHAHLDKAFLAERIPNPAGDLMGAINGMIAHRGSITRDDTIARAERAARLMHAHGVTAIRTHADCTVDNGLQSVDALIAVRDRLRGVVDIQVVALCGFPLVGPAGVGQRRLLADALERGVDLVGGCPHLEADAEAATAILLRAASHAGCGVDLHTDETLRTDALGLEMLANQVLDTGFGGTATASHCVSLGMQTPDRQREIARRVAEAGIGVIALPHTNLFLQGRDHPQAMPRGLTAIAALREAGVAVAAGGDNLQDPFNPLGNGDPLETAALLVLAAHQLPEDALAAVSTVARTVIGLPPTRTVVEVEAGSVREALAVRPAGRSLRQPT